MDAEHSQDRWASWFASRRHGGDDVQLRRTLAQLVPVRDRVIANAAIEPEGRVLDVGCGDGLIEPVRLLRRRHVMLPTDVRAA